MALSKRTVLIALSASLLGAAARAQTWGAGVTLGAVNDVEHHFRWDEFKPKDVAGYLEFEMEPKVILRGTYGQMRMKGENAGKTFTQPDGSQVGPLPDLTQDVRYATLGVSYEFFEGFYTSGIFAGIGGYKIEPRDVPPEIANYRDNRETAFGWHAGVDGQFQVVTRHLYVTIRLTIHGILSTQGRYPLVAGGGLTYRF